MDERRGHGSIERQAWARVGVAMVAVLALALGACGSSDGDAGKVDISGLDDPVTTTRGGEPATTLDGEEPTTTAPKGEAVADDGPDCGLLGTYLVPPVGLSEEDGGDPLPRDEPLTTDEEMAVTRSIGEQLPADLASRWDALANAVEAEARGGTPMGDPEALGLFSVYEDAITWSVENCPDLPPTWACATQVKFQTIGDRIDDDGTSSYGDEEEGVEDPDDVLARFDDPDEAVVLDQSDTAILWGWLDADGLIIRTEQAHETDGRWSSDGASTSCRDDDATGSGDDGFATVGREIDD
jgi:hypothetical protein